MIISLPFFLISSLLSIPTLYMPYFPPLPLPSFPHLPFLSFSFSSVCLPHHFSLTILSTPSFPSLPLSFFSTSSFPSHYPFFLPSLPSLLLSFIFSPFPFLSFPFNLSLLCSLSIPHLSLHPSILFLFLHSFPLLLSLPFPLFRNAGEIQHAKFEESIEKFYTLCDQMELNLVCCCEIVVPFCMVVMV